MAVRITRARSPRASAAIAGFIFRHMGMWADAKPHIERVVARCLASGMVWVARSEGIVGVICVGEGGSAGEYEISYLVVDKRWRRKGIASRLLGRLRAERPDASLFASMHPSNRGVQAFLRNEGFAIPLLVLAYDPRRATE